MYLKYFENAVYQWTGNYGFNLIKEHKIANSLIDPVNLKNIFIIGESISLKQGWIEGALETVENILKKKKFITIEKRHINELKNYVIYNNWILDTSNWLSLHPGGKTVLDKYNKQKINLLYHQIHDSDQSLNILGNLKIGYIDKSMDKNIYYKIIY